MWLPFSSDCINVIDCEPTRDTTDAVIGKDESDLEKEQPIKSKHPSNPSRTLHPE